MTQNEVRMRDYEQQVKNLLSRGSLTVENPITKDAETGLPLFGQCLLSIPFCVSVANVLERK